MGGLVDNPGAAARYHTMTGPATARGSTPSGNLSTTTNTAEVGQQSVHSHLDSFFDGSGWTREDVLVVAAVVQLLAWGALLYMEVS
jgi:hypothetical protein